MHDSIIYLIVGLILCAQLFFFIKNFKKIMAYKNIIVNNEKLSVIELNIDEKQASNTDPDYFIENKKFFQNTKELETEDYGEESSASTSLEANDESIEYGDYGNIDEYEFDNQG